MALIESLNKVCWASLVSYLRMAPHNRGTEVWWERKGTLLSQQVISKNQFWAQHWPGPAHGEHSARNLFTQVFSRTRLTTWSDGSKTSYEGVWCGRDAKSHRSVEKGGEKPLARGRRGRFLRRVGTELCLEQWVGFECEEKSHFSCAAEIHTTLQINSTTLQQIKKIIILATSQCYC